MFFVTLMSQQKSMEQVIELLKSKHLSATPFRLEVASILWQNKQPIFQKELEKRLPESHDRVTLYRTLKLFIEKNLIHRIAIDNSQVAYKLNTNNQSPTPEHLHFYCNLCHQVICMPELPITDVKLPTGFEKSECRFVIDGKCKSCNTTN